MIRILNWLGDLGEAIGGAFLIFIAIVLRPVMHPWYSRWGATITEVNSALPGNEYVPLQRGGYTQAITINATSDKVWPWLVQVGRDRGGFYSYELLENIVGCKIRNADYIIPEFQSLKIGDALILHPKAPAIPLVFLDWGKAIVYGGRQDKFTGNIWTFYMKETGDRTSRLIVRWHFEYKPGLMNWIMYNGLIEPIGAIMQRKMLMGIKLCAERE